MSKQECEIHTVARVGFIDAYENWRQTVCPWCRIAQLEALVRDAGPGLHLCRPACETSVLADAWWKKREEVLK